MGMMTGANAQATGSVVGAAAGAYFGPVGMAVGSQLGGALGGMFGGGGEAKKASKEMIKGAEKLERWYRERAADVKVGPDYLKKIAAEGIDLKLDNLPAISAELDDVDRRTLDDQQRATSLSLAGAGLRGNTRAIAAGQDSLARMRENVVRAARERSISERDKAFERGYREQTFEVGQQASAATQLSAVHYDAMDNAFGQYQNKVNARAMREGAQTQQRAVNAGNLSGALMGIASSFPGSNGGFSWGNSGPGQGGNAGQTATPFNPAMGGGSSYLGTLFNTTANSRKIASQPSPVVTTRPAGMTGSEWTARI